MTSVEKHKKMERLTNSISILVSILNSLLILQLISGLWGFKFSFTNIKLTKFYLKKYEYYIRIMVTVLFLSFIPDSMINNYYVNNYGTKPPRIYRFIYCIFFIITCILGYYVYEDWIFVYLLVYGVLALVKNIYDTEEIENEIKRSELFGVNDEHN